MIKTIPYNDFTAYDWKELQDHEFMFQEMKKFVEAGGDLSYAVMHRNNQIINFADYIKSNFSVDFMDKLMEDGLIKSPFSFILNADEKYITEDHKYGLKWMRENFDKFNKQIIQSIAEISKKSNGCELDYYSQVNYDGLYVQHKKNPLFHIASQLENAPDVWKSILENNSDMHEFMKKFLSDNNNFDFFFRARAGFVNSELANIFYKHNIIDNYLNKNSYIIYDMTSSAVYNNSFQVLNKLIKNFNLPQIEKEQKIDDCFLKKANTPEVANILLRAGCFSIGIWENDGKSISYGINENMDGDTLSAIINYVDKELAVQHHHYFYKTFFKNFSNLDTIKTLVEKHNFPLEKYDMLQVGQKIGAKFSSFESIKWLLEHGADPRNCENFIETIITQRDEGKKALALYKKEGLLDVFSSDIVYAMANNKEMKKVFTNYYEKITSEQLSRYTKNGYPAWFGVNSQEFFTVIKNKIEDYNQLSLQGESWLNSLLCHRNKIQSSDSETLKWLEKAKESIIKKGGTKISGATGKDSERNFLHELFYLTKYSKTYVNTELVKFIFENVEADFIDLINKKDKNGQYPLHNFFFYNNNTPNENEKSNILNTLNYLVQTLGKDFPFEQEINGQKLNDLLTKYDSKIIKETYLAFNLNKLLPEKTEKSHKIKI